MTDITERLDLLDKHLAVVQEEQKAVLKELGVSGETDIVAVSKKQDAAAATFDRLTPAERLELYNTDRDKWSEMLKAKEAAGTRQLFQGLFGA